MIDATAPAPDMRESVYQNNRHNLTRAYDQQAQQQARQTAQAYGR